MAISAYEAAKQRLQASLKKDTLASETKHLEKAKRVSREKTTEKKDTLDDDPFITRED